MYKPRLNYGRNIIRFNVCEIELLTHVSHMLKPFTYLLRHECTLTMKINKCNFISKCSLCLLQKRTKTQTRGALICFSLFRSFINKFLFRSFSSLVAQSICFLPAYAFVAWICHPQSIIGFIMTGFFVRF